jgi:eukaryotic-like serine/threonine-protein kinase
MRPDDRGLEDDAALADLAGAILDGAPVDWAAIESVGSDAQRALIRELRLLADVTALHHSLPTLRPLASTPGAQAADGKELAGYWGHLKVIERIGHGTFGEVFRAWDSRLDRDVALKLRVVAAAQSRGSDQHPAGSSIVEEGRLLARVRHPNVITVYGAERIAGRIGIWTELIEGRTLEQVIRDDGPLAVEEATAVGIDVCGALAAVHDAGLFHGDIKAQNVMRDAGGRTVVMDFGAGSMQLEARSRTDDLAGTPLYLAPELLQGQEATPRSEIYSVGVLLFHLVTGSYPVVARTLDGVRDAHLHGRRGRLTDVRRDLPPAFVAVVDRALEGDPLRRYDSSGALEAALRATQDRAGRARRVGFVRAALGLGAIILLVSTSIVLDVGGSRRLLSIGRDRTGASAIEIDPIRIAILPFVNTGGGSDNDAMANGLAEDLIARLNAFEGVRVISSASAFSFRGTALPLRDIGARLKVSALLTGTARRSGDTLEVGTRLVSVPDERELWERHYTRPVAELFAMQAEISSGIAETLRLRLGRAAQRWPTANPEAYALYLRGRAAWAGRTSVGARTALKLFEQAAALDPEFAQAHAGIAMAHHQLAEVGQELAPEAAYPRVAEAAARALALDETLPEAHLAAANVKVFERDWRGVERERRRAIELGPNSALAHEQYGIFLSLMGRFPEALDHVRLAQSLDLLSPRATWAVATVLRYARRYDEAIAEARRALDLDPNYGAAYHTLGLCYEAKGRLDEAINAYLQAGRGANGNLGHAYAVAGRAAEARTLLASLEERYLPGGHAGQIAQIYIGLRDHERAFEWLARGAGRMPANVPTWKVAEIWDPLRSDPRFRELLESAGLAEPEARAK